MHRYFLLARSCWKRYYVYLFRRFLLNNLLACLRDTMVFTSLDAIYIFIWHIHFTRPRLPWCRETETSAEAYWGKRVNWVIEIHQRLLFLLLSKTSRTQPQRLSHTSKHTRNLSQTSLSFVSLISHPPQPISQRWEIALTRTKSSLITSRKGGSVPLVGGLGRLCPPL